ncbi:MAG: hypothetical protein AVDCRST_MAG85-739, partial [uncultured Solirubrobacteraceae bacterium]
DRSAQVHRRSLGAGPGPAPDRRPGGRQRPRPGALQRPDDRRRHRVGVLLRVAPVPRLERRAGPPHGQRADPRVLQRRRPPPRHDHARRGVHRELPRLRRSLRRDRDGTRHL